MWKVPSRLAFVMAFEVFSLMQVIKTLTACVIHWYSHFLLTLAPGENSNSLPSRLQSSDGLTCFVSLGNSHQWANHHMCLMKTHEKKWQTLVTMLFLFIMAKILAFQTKTTHPSLVSMSANRAEDDRRDMKCRWSNRRGGQARQQQGGKTQTEPKGQSQDRGRKETRRCRGSARGDVPGEGEQGRAS